MSLVKWRNRDLMPTVPNWIDNFFRDDDLFGSSFFPRRMDVPAVNIKETDKSFELEVAAPGMKKDDFNVEIKEGMLYISAETKMEKEEKEDDYTRKEFSYSSFNRSFWLPENVKTDAIKANYVDGVLHLSLPKTKVEKKAPSKVIKIS